ncbi:MAG: SGNH/GDSL hydrolase family protein [Clostridia bacterium]|nr:SGNH/GDSL hydrolase family protein [Clostridia bacterium]
MNILLQGDSITDAGRGLNITSPNSHLGDGYATMVAGELSSKNPDLKFYNRGVSGNRISDMYGRWIEDALNIDFDVLSILNGINDTGFGLRLNKGSDKERFNFIYDRMLYEALEKNPNAKLILMQPFVFKVYYNDPQFGNDIYENYDLWRNKVREYGEVVFDLAKKYNAIYVPLFDIFEEKFKTISPDTVSADGIHPNATGHGIIKDEWIKAFNKLGL